MTSQNYEGIGLRILEDCNEFLPKYRPYIWSLYRIVIWTIQTPNGGPVFRQQIIGIIHTSKAGSSV